MSNNNVRVRIAPSPTGFAHVGTAYAALFNYAFAKRNKGKFIVRVEDTDIEREVKGAEKAIYQGLSWLGLSWDEGPEKGGKYGPYRQSERLDIYKKKADELLEANLAYQDEGAIRFRNPGKDVSWNDEIRGEVSFPGDQITDFVIIKSNGYPTYNFAVAIDDSLMEISHVIRGEEHISNTPRQLVIYQALKTKPPIFAHLPTLRNKARKKLSKRRDPVDLEFFKKQGYLPEALINFLCLLGWSHPKEKEVFDLREFVSLFDLARVRRAGPIFDTNKLDWLNGEYIRNLKDNKLNTLIFNFYQKRYLEAIIKEIIPLIKTRINKLSEFKELAGFFFKAPRVDKSDFGKEWKKHLKVSFETLTKIDKWEKPNIDKSLLKAIDINKFKTGNFFMDLRVAITGKRFTPPINDSLVILGKDETLDRIKSVM